MIERYEFKYIIHETQVPAIRAAALRVGARDAFAGPNGEYPIRSLYLDTPGKHLYWANDREAPERFKVRIRCYPNAPKAPVFLEVKGRSKDVIRKSRAAITGDWRAVARGEREAIAALPARAQNAAKAFARNYLTYHLEPAVLVEYDREAFGSHIDEYARLTIDRAVRCQLVPGLCLEADPRSWRRVDNPVRTDTTEPHTILELKFQTRPPRWMVDLVRKLELPRRSFSKYCYSVEALLTLPEARTPRLQMSDALPAVTSPVREVA